jgi:hypothetical protein
MGFTTVLALLCGLVRTAYRGHADRQVFEEQRAQLEHGASLNYRPIRLNERQHAAQER